MNIDYLTPPRSIQTSTGRINKASNLNVREKEYLDKLSVVSPELVLCPQNSIEQLGTTTITFGNGQFLKQTGQTQVVCAVTFAADLFTILLLPF